MNLIDPTAVMALLVAVSLAALIGVALVAVSPPTSTPPVGPPPSTPAARPVRGYAEARQQPLTPRFVGPGFPYPGPSSFRR